MALQDLSAPADLVRSRDLAPAPDLAVPPDLSQNPLAIGLLGYWPLDGNGDDLSGGARPLTIMGGAGFAAGLYDRALDLHADGSQYAIRSMDDAVFNFGARDFSIQAWANYNQTAGIQVPFEKFSGTGGPGWTLTKLASNELHFWTNPSAVLTSPAQTTDKAVWHHYLVRRQGAKFDGFYDGHVVVSGSSTVAVPDTTRPLLVGRRNDGDGRVFPVDGRIDELAIWDRALSDAEITALYNGGSGQRLISR